MAYKFQKAQNLTFEYTDKNFGKLTFPPIEKKTALMQINQPYSGILALKDETPIGLILADKANQQGISELFSFFVTKEERNKGIGKKMLVLLNKMLSEDGVKHLNTRYWNTWGSYRAIEKMLDSNGWNSAQTLMFICEIAIDKYHVVNWPELKFSKEHSIFCWEDLKEKDREAINTMLSNGIIPTEFNPFNYGDKIYYTGSVGLRYQNRLVGWNISYILRDDMIEYNNLFILPEYRNHGLALSLLKESFGKQYEAKIPHAKWIVHARNKVMVKIFQYITTGHLSKITEVKFRNKKLE